MTVEELDSNYKKLRECLLPNTGDEPAPNFSEDELRKITAFCVMMHAEFEHFIEVTIKNKFNIVFSSIQTQPSYTIIPNLFYYYGRYIDLKNDKGLNVKNLKNKAADWYRNTINENHGIKIVNLQNMLRPLGMDIDTFDQTLLNELDSFGAKRGKFAHGSFQSVMNEVPDPKSLCITIEYIINLLNEFQIKINSFN